MKNKTNLIQLSSRWFKDCWSRVRQLLTAGTILILLGGSLPTFATTRANMVKDIYVGEDPAFVGYGENVTAVGSNIYFSLTDANNGAELWKSDGIEFGATLVQDINPGPYNSSPSALTEHQGILYFQATSRGRRGIWKSDGTTAGTVPVKLFPASTTGQPFGGWYHDMLSMNDTLFFVADDGVWGYELWKSNGTEAGTVLIKDIASGSASAMPYELTEVNGTLFFITDDGNHGAQLWKSDGTEAGTVLVRDEVQGTTRWSLARLTNMNGMLYFYAWNTSNGEGLWRSDGTTEGTVPISTGKRIDAMLTTNSKLFFSVRGSNGGELWMSDGTIAGTNLLKAFNTGPETATIFQLVSVGAEIFFAGYDVTHGGELWRSDGTTDGTVMVKDLNPGPYSSDPHYLTGVKSTLFFIIGVDSSVELWRSDGTGAGTRLLRRIGDGTSAVWVDNLTSLNDTLFFNANDGVNGRELWRSDGTPEGTDMLKNAVTPYSSQPDNLTKVNDTLFFTADDGIHGRDLWRSDGTLAGTYTVMGLTHILSATELINLNDSLLFATPSALWRSDSTPSGTTMLQNLGYYSRPHELTNVNGTLFFVDADLSLWKSDGTPAGTTLVRLMSPQDVPGPYREQIEGPGEGYGEPATVLAPPVKSEVAPMTNRRPPEPLELCQLTNVDGQLYFTLCYAHYDSSVPGLWKSDGTVEGTVLIHEVRAFQLTNMNGTLFFAGKDGDNDMELWKSDGTRANTIPVKDIVSGSVGSYPSSLTNVNGTLFFTTDDQVYGRELWKSDGTANGTVMVKDINVGSDSSNPYYLTNVHGTLFFSSDEGIRGHELWKSDGTPEGTMLVRDILPGVEGGSPALLTALQQGTVLFTANDGLSGVEIWESDGTHDGTMLLADLATGPGSSNPSKLQGLGAKIFLVADDNLHGAELWTLDATVANHVPTASQVTYKTYISTSMTGILPASDLDSDTLTFSVVANASHGIATITNVHTGAFSYTPMGEKEGKDRFTFKVSDGLAESNLSTVEIEIQANRLYLPLVQS